MSKRRGEYRVPLSSILDGGDNVRFDMGEVAELAESIKRLGVLQPLVVTPEGDDYLLVAGHRRFAAAKLAGLDKVPVIERELTSDERVEVMVAENVHRKNLTHLEEAKAYKRIMDRDGLTQRELSERLGISPTTINKKLRLLALPAQVQKDVIEGRMALQTAIDENPAYKTVARRRESWHDRKLRIQAMPGTVYVVVAYDSSKAPAQVSAFIDPENAFALRDQLARTQTVNVYPCELESSKEENEAV